MNATRPSYYISNFTLGLVIIGSIVAAFLLRWNDLSSVNFMGGDAKDYYSSLVSIFINKDFQHQAGDDWYLLKTDSGIVNVHPIGEALLLLPFFLLALVFSYAFNLPITGYDLPFQVSVAVAAMFYVVVGLNFLKKLFEINSVPDKMSALLILLIFFGTNLLHYTVSEAGMSHVYSFALISIFLFYSCSYISNQKVNTLYLVAAILGLILLVRPNNIFVVGTVFIWFKSWEHCKAFFNGLFKNKNFYLAISITIGILFLQSIVWYLQSGHFLQNTYKRDGFYWTRPHILDLLFGFDGGFFVYTPLCLLLSFGIISLFKENKFSGIAVAVTLSALIYFFASYWAYTYFDGFGIRVLVDYYSLFGFLGGKLFLQLQSAKTIYGSVLTISILLVALNFVYTYQANNNILLRAGMTFTKWKYIFLRTGSEYQNCLGGSSELLPYAAVEPSVALSSALDLNTGHNFVNSEYGPSIAFQRIGFDSNRLRVNLDCRRKELYLNSSKNVHVCMSVEDPETKKSKTYVQFKLNETPSVSCCDPIDYSYSANIVGDFKAGDRLSVYLWNTKKEAFVLEKLAVEVYNYNYQLN